MGIGQLRLATVQTAVRTSHHNTFVTVDTTLSTHSLNEPKNVAVVIGPQTRNEMHWRRMGQSLNIQHAGMAREKYPTTRRKGIVGSVDIDYRIGVEVCDRSLQHGEPINVRPE
jgi:hypothetical protein